jgi:hypothetical protein
MSCEQFSSKKMRQLIYSDQECWKLTQRRLTGIWIYIYDLNGRALWQLEAKTFGLY